MTAYVAFLRGINVGGHKKVPMAALKRTCENMGLQHVQTLLATGNVLFEAKEKNPEMLAQMLASKLEKTFGFTIGTIVRPASDIEKMIKDNPFRQIRVTPQTRLYVTFLPEKTKSRLAIPYVSPDKSFSILDMTDTALYSVLDLTKTHTTDAMQILDKEFGKAITTRNWNTIQGIADALEQDYKKR